MKLRFHLLLVALVAVATGLIFLDEPKFGDDFTYWYHAFNLHERGLDAWSRESFHQIRWPVWGVCWVLQAIFGPGLISYYGTPYLYLSLGALAAFVVGWKILKRATWDMAAYLGQEQRLGSIEKGKLADFFLVPGDPTKDLTMLKRASMVVKDGTVYFPSEIYPHFGIKPFATPPAVTLPRK